MKNKNKQANIANEYGLKASEVKDFRDNYLSIDADWWKEGTTIYWSDEAIDMLGEYLFVKEQNEELSKIENSPEIKVKIISLANNAKYVYGALDGNRINILCRRPINPSLVGKMVEITKEVNPDGTSIYEFNN